MGNINFNIVSGAPPFEAELIGSLKPNQVFNNTGQYSFNDVSNGVYTLRISDANGCVYEKEVIVNPNITTTTTTTIPGNSIIVGHAQDSLLIFNVDATNKNGDYTGYPDSDIVTLYLWFKTNNGEPLNNSKILNYRINTTGGTADSTFEFNRLSDQVHAEVQENITGPNDTITGDIVLKEGFIETFFEYTYYRGTNRRFQINIESPLDDLNPNLETKIDAGTTYGITSIDINEINFDY